MSQNQTTVEPWPIEPPSEDECEAAAKELWNRFAPSHAIDWEDESHKAVYVGAAMAVIRIWGKQNGR